MCQGDGVSRCPGCPGTDWSAFTWEYNAPASPGVFQPVEDGLIRFFQARNTRMIKPDAGCGCLWLCGAGDFASDPAGVLNPIGTHYPISALASLQYRRWNSRGTWKIQLSRWYGYWNWSIENLERYGYGWGWNDDLTAGDACNSNGVPYYGGYWGGWGGWGYNGWGWAWGGYYAYAAYYGDAGQLYAVTYSIADGGEMNCHGEWVRFVLDTPTDPTYFDADAWPAFIDVRRVQK